MSSFPVFCSVCKKYICSLADSQPQNATCADCSGLPSTQVTKPANRTIVLASPVVKILPSSSSARPPPSSPAPTTLTAARPPPSSPAFAYLPTTLPSTPVVQTAPTGTKRPRGSDAGPRKTMRPTDYNTRSANYITNPKRSLAIAQSYTDPTHNVIVKHHTDADPETDIGRRRELVRQEALAPTRRGPSGARVWASANLDLAMDLCIYRNMHNENFWVLAVKDIKGKKCRSGALYLYDPKYMFYNQQVMAAARHYYAHRDPNFLPGMPLPQMLIDYIDEHGIPAVGNLSAVSAPPLVEPLSAAVQDEPMDEQALSDITSMVMASAVGSPVVQELPKADARVPPFDVRSIINYLEPGESLEAHRNNYRAMETHLRALAQKIAQAEAAQK